MIGLMSLLKEVQGKPKAIFMAGPAGSGKSFILQKLIPSNFNVINVDDTKQHTIIEAGLYHTFVVDADGKLYASGSNSNGQLGFPPQKIKNVFACAKIYDTRSGTDPLFPESLLEGNQPPIY